MTKKPEVIIAIISLIIAIFALIFGDNIYQQITRRSFFDNEVATPEPTIRISPNLSSVVFSDKFDGSNGSYDSNLWDCVQECNLENLLLRDGVLQLQRDKQGHTRLVSRSTWTYNELISLTGKFQIVNGASYIDGWISISNIAGCYIDYIADVQSPFIYCNGGGTNEEVEYVTEQFPAQFDKWYQIRIEFNTKDDLIQFYIDGTLIGEHSVVAHADSGQLDIGIVANWRIANLGIIYMDDITVTTNK